MDGYLTHLMSLLDKDDVLVVMAVMVTINDRAFALRASACLCWSGAGRHRHPAG